MDLKEIKAIIDLMKKNDLAVFKLEKEGFKIELEAHRHAAPFVPIPHERQVSGVTPTAAPQVAAQLAAAVPEQKTTSKEIVSPMVGTFYRAPSPDSAPYVIEGQEVSEETVVCIIEAMKVMNEIKAELKGEVIEVLVENGTAVQFGQPLFRVK